MEIIAMEIIAIAVLCVVLIGVALLWISEHKAKSQARAALDEAQAELQRAGDEFSELEKKLQALSARTSLVEFPPESAYQLLAKGLVNVGHTEQAFGVVKDESGNDITFLTAQDLAAIAVGDTFTCVRGQIAKLSAGFPPKRAVPAPASPVDDATQPLGGMARASVKAPRPPSPPPQAPPPPPADIDDDDDDDDMNKTVMFLPGKDKAKKKDENAGLPFLEVLEGPDQGKSFPLHFDSSTIGRELGNVIALSDTGASRTHCVVDYGVTSFRLRDNNSTNGTLCNGEKITEKHLDFGDRIKVADTTMAFTCKGFQLKDSKPAAAIAAFEETLEREPDFVGVLKNLAFLLERDIGRQKEAQPLWERIMKLDKSR